MLHTDDTIFFYFILFFKTETTKIIIKAYLLKFILNTSLNSHAHEERQANDYYGRQAIAISHINDSGDLKIHVDIKTNREASEI